MEYNFVHPKRFEGFFIFEDDDGSASLQDRWNLIKQYKEIQYSKFPPFNDAMSYAPCVNASFIGNEGRLTVEQLQVMQQEGAEIVNHGKYHASFLSYVITESVSQGATTIVAESVRPGNFEHLETEIFDNEKSEVLFVSSVSTDSVAGTTTFTLSSPLANSYSNTDAQVRLTSNGINEEVNGGRQILLSWGLNVRHYVNAYHHSTSLSQSIIAEEHYTARQLMNGSHSFPIGATEDYNMRSWRWSDFDTDKVNISNDIKENKKFAQIYAHGGSTGHDIMRTVLKRNIRVISKADAYKLIVNDRESRV